MGKVEYIRRVTWNLASNLNTMSCPSISVGIPWSHTNVLIFDLGRIFCLAEEQYCPILKIIPLKQKHGGYPQINDQCKLIN